MSSPFHSGMNHWQRQWLSDRLHKKSRPTSASNVEYLKTQPVAPHASHNIQILKDSIVPKRKTSSSLRSKISWPTAAVLEKLLWEKPTSKIAKDLGISDKAVEKHCKKLSLKKPPRGYWAKLKVE